MDTLRCFAIALLLGGCVATPLPTPPSADPQRMTLTEDPAGPSMDLRGAPGAIGGDVLRVRVTSSRAWVEAGVDGDGSFEVRELAAPALDTLFLEALTDDGDVFLLAVRGGTGDTVVEASAGEDSDGDGSPDRVDCAPDDGSLESRECSCVAEVCNGHDDDCNGTIDEGCVDADGDGSFLPDDCDDGDVTVFPGAAEACDGADDSCDGVIDEGCAGACVSDSDCLVGERCEAGFCVSACGALMLCGTQCVDITSDSQHCGGCDSPCDPGESCMRSVCMP